MENLTVIIRRANEKDIESLSDLCAKTFFETYLPARPHLEKDFTEYVNTNFSTKAVERKLLDPKIIYLVAEANGKLLGYCEINLQKSPEGKNDETCINLDQIYLLKEVIGKGVGKQLMDEFLNISKQEKSALIWLQVWEKNLSAQNFYKKSGFEIFGTIEFRFGSAIDIDLLMKKRLKSPF